jgi:hypothetical protein
MTERHDPDCPLCINAFDIPPEQGGGWWGDESLTHCHRCGNTWRGKRVCECTVCHVLFGGTAGFDQHIRRGGQHVHPSEVGLISTVNDFGCTVWRREIEFRKAS